MKCCCLLFIYTTGVAYTACLLYHAACRLKCSWMIMERTTPDLSMYWDLRWTDFINGASIINGGALGDSSYHQGLEARNMRVWTDFQISKSSTLALLLSLTWLSTTCADCPTMCGNVTIPYPFGIEPGCGLSQFLLNCTHNITTGKIAPFLPSLSESLEVLNIDPQKTTILLNTTDLKAQSCTGRLISDGKASLELSKSSPYVLSMGNLFFVTGCNSSGSVSTDLSVGPSKCITNCFNDVPTDYPFCNIYGCCTANLPSGSRTINFSGGGVPYVGTQGGCGYSSIIFPKSYMTQDPTVNGNGYYGVRLSWAITGANCSTVSTSVCAAQATCKDVESVPGYACTCNTGYTGDGFSNGYGCEDINECADPSIHKCSQQAVCLNTDGSYKCQCKRRFSGDGFLNGTGCAPSASRYETVVTASVSASGLCVILLGGFVTYLATRKRQTKRIALDAKQRFVKANMKTLKSMKNKNKTEVIKETISSSTSTRDHSAPNLLSLHQLEKATGSFANDNMLGTGGFGTVYKGTMEDGVMVAIKKINNMNRLQGTQQILNEVAILSQVNHRNLVRLLGCCMETEVPLLVYEFISNGTLEEHLQNKRGEGLPWRKRLQIAISTAEALAYLHSAALSPIYHRDVKSSNILLDQSLTVKVADFGLSRLVPADVTHISTTVQGTPGYLDPEYYLNFQLTDKSDVYSFGVVLLEIITAQKPVDFMRLPCSVNLASLCVRHVNDLGTISELIDPNLQHTDDFPGFMESIEAVAKLAVRCLMFHHADRPTMKQVLEELMMIEGFTNSFGHNIKGSATAASNVSSRPKMVDEHVALSLESSFEPWPSFRKESS